MWRALERKLLETGSDTESSAPIKLSEYYRGRRLISFLSSIAQNIHLRSKWTQRAKRREWTLQITHVDFEKHRPVVASTDNAWIIVDGHFNVLTLIRTMNVLASTRSLQTFAGSRFRKSTSLLEQKRFLDFCTRPVNWLKCVSLTYIMLSRIHSL